MQETIPGITMSEVDYLREFLSMMREAEAFVGAMVDSAGMKDGVIAGHPKDLFCIFVMDVLLNSVVTLESQYEILGSQVTAASTNAEEIESAVQELLYIQIRKLLEGLAKVVVLTHHNNDRLYAAFVSDEINKGWSKMLDHVNQAFGMEFYKPGDLSNRAFKRVAQEKKQSLEKDILSKLDEDQRKAFDDACNANAITLFKSAFEIANDQERGLISLYPMLSPASNFVHFNIRRFSLLFAPPMPLSVLLAIICQTATIIMIRLFSVLGILPSERIMDSISKFLPNDSIIMKMLRRHYEPGETVNVLLPSGKYQAEVIECIEKGLGLVVVKVDMSESNPPEYQYDNDKSDWFPALNVTPHSIESESSGAPPDW